VHAYYIRNIWRPGSDFATSLSHNWRCEFRISKGAGNHVSGMVLVEKLSLTDFVNGLATLMNQNFHTTPRTVLKAQYFLFLNP
jgi:hypothetical protein